MKRFFSLILAVILILPMAVPTAAEDSTISIKTREDLEAISKNPDGCYRLDADIDLGDKDWMPIPFSGTLQGGGHVLYNLKITVPGADSAVTVDGNNKTYDTHFAALFSICRNAVIEDLNVIGAQVNVETGDHCFAAILAGYMEDTEIRNCVTEGCVRLYTTNKMVGTGGVAGFGTGKIEGCRVTADLTFADRSSRESGMRCEQFMGGLIACGNADLVDNTVEIQGFDSCWGFVHNGGLVGMHYRWDKDHHRGQIVGNTVRGKITFFENNPNRRAYCGPFGGELLTYPSKMMKNNSDFKRNELYQQKEELKDHNCENPDFQETKVSHEEKTWGYTLHTCKTCGYQYRTDYQAPGHKVSGWEVLQEPNYEYSGSRRKVCTVCGQVMEEETMPKRIAVSVIILSEHDMKMHYKDTADLKCYVRPKDAENQNVIWTSSDSSVVSVDQQGRLTAMKRGAAVITCESEDGFASSSCSIIVGYSPLQWIIKTLLFGWIWY